MEFSLSAEQRELKEAAAAFARAKLNQDLAKREEAGEFSLEAWRACAEFGIQGLPVPAGLGGGGSDILTTVLVMEGLGYGCQDNGLIFSLNAQMWSIELPLVKFGTPAQQQAYLPGLVSGDLIGVHAMTEPESGSDAFSMRTRAERVGDHYRLSGTKLYITNAPVADVVLVFACHPDRPRMAGISAFLVDKGTPGFTVSRSLDKMGLRTSPMGEVVLDDCLVPAENRLGPEGAGMAIFNSSMAYERSCILASALGAMQRQLETCVGHARARKQFGQAIGKFQGVSDKVADMYLRLEAARLLVYRAAWLTQQGKPALIEAAAAKLFTSEAWVASSLDAIQIHGAYGYMKEAGIERDLRDAVAGTIYSGTSEIQRVVVSRMLGL
jgi:alkylation response protein AidB-like acyl-CoA dehydrogenase